MLSIVSKAEAQKAGLVRYFTGSPCKRGHVAERNARSGVCIECHRDSSRRHYEANSSLILAAQGARYRRDPEFRERKKLAARERFQSPEAAPRIKAWKQSARHKEYMRHYLRARIHSDLEFRLSGILRGRLAIAAKARGVSGEAIRLLGCTVAELACHLEAQFKPGMSWDNWGRGDKGAREWQIDHRRPLSSFDLTNPADLAEACHFTNLQPLWAIENRKKWVRGVSS